MSTTIMAACWPIKMPPTQKAVLISLADNANDHGACWPSISTICTRTCFGKTAVIEAIQWLEQAGYVVADRENGRHTKYQIIPAGADLFAPKPVRQPNQSASRTSPPAEPVHEADPSASRSNLSASRTEPVRQADTNRQEPSRTREREKTRARAGDQLPDGIDPDRWVAYCAQADHDGKLSTPRLLTALGQLRALVARGVDCNAVLDAAVMRGLRDLSDVARRLQDESRQPPPRGGPSSPGGQSCTNRAITKLLEASEHAKSRVDGGRNQRGAGEIGGSAS